MHWGLMGADHSFNLVEAAAPIQQARTEPHTEDKCSVFATRLASDAPF